MRLGPNAARKPVCKDNTALRLLKVAFASCDEGENAVVRKAWQFGMLAIVIVSIAETHPANALDVFGMKLFGESSAESAGALPYRVSLDVAAPEDGSLKKLIAGVSHLMVEQQHGANDAYSLVARARGDIAQIQAALRSEEHTSELQSLSSISYAVFCLRSEERRVGKECSLPCRSRWSPYH